MATSDQQSAGGKMVVVTGPSGVGKSTILHAALERTGSTFSVSATTRQPRPGEVDGRDYYFVDRQEFRRMIDADQLLEWAEVFGEYYGTPAEPVRRQLAEGRSVVLDIDVQGAIQVHQKSPDATYLFILPPSLEVLRERLTGRGTETPEQLDRRLGKAAREIEKAEQSGIYTHKVINDDLGSAIEAVCRIIEQ
jgi:guanylate kinase